MTEYEVEYGSISPIRWAPSFCLNADGSEAMCDCGNRVTTIIQGSVFTWILCNDCEKKLIEKSSENNA